MNKIYLIGNSCRDCELANAGDKQYSRINLAVGRKFDRDKTDFFNCTAFGKTAEIVAKYVKKGTKIALSGRIEFNEGTDGKQYHSVIVDDLELLSRAATNTEAATDTAAETDENLPF